MKDKPLPTKQSWDACDPAKVPKFLPFEGWREMDDLYMLADVIGAGKLVIQVKSVCIDDLADSDRKAFQAFDFTVENDLTTGKTYYVKKVVSL